MGRAWSVHPPLEEADALASRLSIHPAVMNILLRRGIRSERDILRYMKPSPEDLENPSVFTDMDKAVNLIRHAISAKEKILVYGDYDVDGVTAAAILFPILRSLGADTEIHLPHRVDEGYGLNQESLAVWLKRGVRLVITVDNGITSFEPVRYLKENGVKVILVDHHIPKGEAPPADAIISGAVPGKGNPDSPLAACGLAFKLGWALLQDLQKVEPYLDLVTLGTVADLAPVEGDNRILLKWGLPKLSRSRRPGVRALMEAARIHPDFVTYRDIAFGLGPRINAAGRMGSPMDAFKLLTTDNALEARNLAQVLEAGNKLRQDVEAEAYREAARIVETELGEEEHHAIVVASSHWHEGVLGIVAARLVERFHRPAFAISIKEGLGKGSGRSVAGFSLFDHAVRCEELFESFGGHAQACGLKIREANIGEFRKRLNVLAAPSFQGAGSGAALWVETEIPIQELDTRLLSDLEKLAPFGPGNPKPLFLSKGLRLKGEIKKRGKDTLQCWMSDPSGKVTCEVIGFRSYERWSKEEKTKREFDIVYQPTLRNFNGISSITLELESWR